MKTRQYIIAMLIVLIFVTVTIQAQPARRSHSQEKKEKTRTTQPARQAQRPQVQHQQRTTQPARQVQKPQVQRQQRSTQPARQVQKPQIQRQQRTIQPASQAQKPQVQRQQRTTQPARQVQKPQTQQNRTARQTQRSTAQNPRRTDRKANSNVYVDHNQTGNSMVNKYSSERYYSGHHYHNAYPNRKVKFHYHHDTYVHNYRVLYYPIYTNIYWSINMYRDYHRWYPDYHWRYSYGYRIQTISAFDAKYNLGEVAMVYGRIYSTWHNVETDDYLLFIGEDYPYQQFTVVLPGNVARRFSWRPDRYFLGEHLTVTGLITTFDGSPEIIVKNKRQVGVY